MSTKYFRMTHIPRTPGVVKVEQDSTGFLWDFTNLEFTATPALDYGVPTEDANFPGVYSLAVSAAAFADDTYRAYWYESAAMTGAPVVSALTLVDDTYPVETSTAPTVQEIRAEIDTNSTQLAAILEDTGTTIPALIPTFPTNFSSLSIDGSGKVDLIADQIGVTIGTTNALGTQAKADVNAEVVDSLNTDTYTEPGQEAPGVNVSLVKKIGYLYKAWRNRATQTASQYSLYGDNATTLDQKATFADDGTTADRGRLGRGRNGC